MKSRAPESLSAVSRLLAGITLACAASGAAAQSYPAKPVRIVVPFPAGGNADIFARLHAQKLSDTWGQPVVVDNRAGAAGIIGTRLVTKSPADGYTLLLGITGTHTTNPAVHAKLPYDPLRDFAPVSNLADSPFLLVVHPSVPAYSLRELVALAKSRRGQLNYASFGTGSSAHLATEGATPLGNSPEEFAEQIRKDHARWAKVAKDAGIKPQ